MPYHISDQADEHGSEDQATEHGDRKHRTLPEVVNPNFKPARKPHLKYSTYAHIAIQHFFTKASFLNGTAVLKIKTHRFIMMKKNLIVQNNG